MKLTAHNYSWLNEYPEPNTIYTYVHKLFTKLNKRQKIKLVIWVLKRRLIKQFSFFLKLENMSFFF